MWFYFLDINYFPCILYRLLYLDLIVCVCLLCFPLNSNYSGLFLNVFSYLSSFHIFSCTVQLNANVIFTYVGTNKKQHIYIKQEHVQAYLTTVPNDKIPSVCCGRWYRLINCIHLSEYVWADIFKTNHPPLKTDFHLYRRKYVIPLPFYGHQEVCLSLVEYLILTKFYFNRIGSKLW